MNSLHIIKDHKLLNLFNTKPLIYKLVAVLLLSAMSTLSFANRPAMEEVEEEMENQQAAETNTEAPSSVELMMQGSQNSGGMMQLPGKEIQPGETIQIKLLDYPRRGMSMDKVKNEYGQPNAISNTVGQPPITRWTYSDRVVYFEYSTVLHVVAR